MTDYLMIQKEVKKMMRELDRRNMDHLDSDAGNLGGAGIHNLKNPVLTLDTPISVLNPEEWNSRQLRNALKKIAPGCSPEDILLIIDCDTDTSLLSIFDINSCKHGMVLCRDCFWSTIIAKGYDRKSVKIPQPIRFEDIVSVTPVAQTDCFLRFHMSGGKRYDAYVGIYGEFTYRLLKMGLEAWQMEHVPDETPMQGNEPDPDVIGNPEHEQAPDTMEYPEEL